jgi:hypothetical protein
VPVVAQQKRNTYIKEIAETAGFTRAFLRVRFRAGKAEEEPLPLWQAITTYTPGISVPTSYSGTRVGIKI